MIAVAALLAILPLLASAAPFEKRATNVRINFNGDQSRVSQTCIIKPSADF